MESAAVQEYTYHPLNSTNQEIRLITIKAGCEPEPVKCSLTHISLNDKPPYEALSYTWGDPDYRSHIILDGCNFSVTSNLGTALPYLRLPEVDRIIWIDAICINQNDLAERESQVQIMGIIYQEAEKVISWIDALKNESMFTDTAAFLYEGRNHDFSTAWIRGAISDPTYAPRFSAILRFFSEVYDYWYRMWVTQELALARKGVVKWKEIEIPYEYFVEFSNALSQALKDVSWAGNHMRIEYFYLLQFILDEFAGSDIVRRTVPGTPLLKLLQRNRHKKASDPRDKVYALLGLSDMAPDSHEGLTLNYSKNWSKMDVYTGVVRAMVDKTCSLDIICEASLGSNVSDPDSSQETKLPSWTPDWTAPMRSMSNLTESRIGAAGTMLANVNFYNDKNVMKAQGLCVGTVGACERCLPDTIVTKDPKEIALIRDVFYSWLATWTYHAGKSVESFDAFSRTIHCGSEVKPYLRDLLFGKDHRSDPSSWHPAAPDIILLQFVQKRLARFRFFIMNPIKDRSLPDGDMPLIPGIGPEQIQENDRICVLLGCKSPVAIRPDGDRYRFVSAVFIDSLSDGQAIEGLETGRYSLEWFELH